MVRPEKGQDVEKDEPDSKRVKLDEDGADGKSDDKPGEKKWDKKNKKKNRGQNKSRPIFKEDLTIKLCRSLIDGAPNPCPMERCNQIHSVQEFWANRQPDVGAECYVFKKLGYCSYGLNCRFSSSHLTEELINMGIELKDKTPVTTYNQIEYELLNTLRKKKYDFKKSNDIIKAINEEKQKPVGAVSEEDLIKPRPREKKTIDFKNKILLSPLTTVGNLPFRRICKSFGVDVTCGEMACAVPLINGAAQEWALTKRHESEDIFGVQICGHKANLCAYASQLIDENFNVDFVDLNIGCPIDLIYQQGGGSALIRRPNVLEEIVRSCSAVLGEKPFTVKTRTGVYADKSVAHELLPKLVKWGASAVTVHGRSREQRYTKNADWEYIEKCAQSVEDFPVFGNGDILSFSDYLEARETAPHISGVMIGRGALIKPWIFQEIKENKHWDISSSERMDIIKKYVNYGLEHWGSDIKGVENTRKFLLEWQSFLYRYVPYGILERPPQKINQRPDAFRGRDDLETLMASPHCQDWIKLSEMLLGPVPEGFTFLPKHKANSY